MNVFYRRPLCLILCIALGSFVFFSIFTNSIVRLTFVLLITLVFALSFLNKFKSVIPTVMTRTACIIALLSSLFSYLYFDLWFNAYDRYDYEATVTGTVTYIDYNSYSTTLFVTTDNIDETPLSNYNIIVYADDAYNNQYDVGSRVKIVGYLSPV